MRRVTSLFFIVTCVSSIALAAPKMKDWTMLVFLNGNNSLDSFGARNINQMEKVGSTNKINVVVQWASLQEKTVKRLFIKRDKDPNTVTSPIVQDAGKVDMGDYKSLVEFVRWGVQNYPARHYFIDVWDHGGGWHVLAQARIPFSITAGWDSQKSYQPLDISLDENTGNAMTVMQLGQALKESAKIIGHKVDLYASDACLMAMPEVSGEMAEDVDVFAGSEETEPGEGWPYDAFLEVWDRDFWDTPQEVARVLAYEYKKSYRHGQNGNQEVTFSAFDLSKTEELHRTTLALAANLASLPKEAKAKVAAVIPKTQSFLYDDFGDYGDFIKNVKSLKLKTINAQTLRAASRALNRFVITNQTTPGNYSKATGVSIWLPQNKKILEDSWNTYSTLKFQKATHWGDAIKSLY